MNPTEIPNRCRVVLIAPEGVAPQRVIEALSGGDVASLILPQWGMDDDAFQKFAEAIVPTAQASGVAVMVGGDVRIAARAKADGIHIETNRASLEEVIEKHQAKLMVGTGGVTTRDDALELGEARPDYMFFGRFGYDTKPEPHPRNLKLGGWWSEMVQIPCIVMAGSEMQSVVEVARTGADFVAVSAAVFAEGVDAAKTIAQANELLDSEAPRFGDEN
ncbi:thiamine phosphate synthase [Aquamicrobium zhengzhouense]|uniref:Thiamine phosphate synthase n=1 Tax=Aquamicrobium zhengzhouense TaxID=2781738 RepID=A0ABS0SGB0_9HYPH|nr:thiamine phosphate synthase [Aquamicrobium zhengzhouense]MBI1622347.1 thiamine phosphate synthase [Aquamicrobium zhengzhouense]